MVSPRRAMRPIVAIYPEQAAESRPGLLPDSAASGRRPSACGRSRVRQDFARARRVAYPVPDVRGRVRVRVDNRPPPRSLSGVRLEWKAPGRRPCRDQEAPSDPTPPRAELKQRRQVAAGRRPGLRAARGRRPSSSSTSRSTSRTPTRTSRPRPRSSTTTTARPSSAGSPPRTASRSALDEMPQSIKDAVVAAENQVLLDRPGHRPQGHPARRLQQRPGQRDPGRVDDHPAVRQDPLPHPGADPQAQGQGSDPLAEAAAPAEQDSRSSRATSTPSTSAAAPTASRPPPRRTSTSRPRTSTCGRAPCWRPCSTTRRTYDPANGKQAQAGPQGALRVRPVEHGRRPAPSPPSQADKAAARAAEVPEDRGRRASTAASAATC